MSILECIACNSPVELTDWLGEKIGQLMTAHANYMANTLPLQESDVPLHAFLSTGLAKEILEDINNSSEFNLSDPTKVEDGDKICFGNFSFPLQGIGWNLDLDELVRLARA